MLRLLVCAGAAISAAAIGCGGSPPEAGSRYVRYHINAVARLLVVIA